MPGREKVNNRRQLKNILINPRYQLKYIFWLSATGLLLTVINCTIFYVFIKENYSILVELVPMPENVRNQLYSELFQIVGYLALVSFIFLLLVSALGLFLSHKTAGPLYHFKRVFTDIKSGRKDARIMLRPGDDFQDVAQSFNEMMNTLK
jgi:methyl-accepting chemotaxis protein